MSTQSPETYPRPFGEVALPYALIAPAIIVALAIAVIPLIYALYLSFQDWYLLRNPQPVWGGLKSGMIELSALHPVVPKATRALIEQRRKDIVAGRFAPFSGRLVDAAGKERLASGSLGDEAIATMNWFVWGVQGGVTSAK